jgi:hypothetical protein
MNRKDKFIKRNQETFTELIDFIKNNRGETGLALISSEMGAYLTYFDLFSEEEYIKAKEGMLIVDVDGRPFRFMIDPYLGADKVQFIMRGENQIKFDVPCVCGIYSDEPHNLI